MENVFVACYQVDEERIPTKKVMKESHDDSLNFHHIVCTTKICFDDESKLFNCPPLF
jgi:hypothetical protein